MTALTTAQLDELETDLNRCDLPGLWPVEIELAQQLIRIARAALAWREARAVHREACEHRGAIDATLPQYQASIDALYKLLGGAP